MKMLNIIGTENQVPLGKIIALGRNYLDHIRELNNPVPDSAVIFCKPPTCIIGEGEQIEIPAYSNDCHHELELALLIGRKGKNIAQEAALEYVAGYAVALDLTLRDLQDELKSKGLPWELAKGFDGSCPLSDFICATRVANPDNLVLTLHINGELRQQGNTNQMMRPVAAIIAVVSRYFTLQPGDVILTGTPAGVGPLHSGDQLVAEIEQVGTLKVSVK